MAMYKCKVCGKEFERIGNGVYCAGPHYRPCPVCGKPVAFHKPSERIKCCSKECTKRLREQSKTEADMRECAECGKKFMPNNHNQKYCSGPHITNCVICGKEITYTSSPTNKPKTCSVQCREVLHQQTVYDRYGVANVFQTDTVKDLIKEYHTSPDTYVHTDKSKGSNPVERICKFCGEPFMAYGTKEYCDRPHKVACAVCGELFDFNVQYPYKKTCSRKCAYKLGQVTFNQQTRICELCGKEFHPNSSMQRYCEDDHYHPCPVCGKPVKIARGSEALPAVCCSTECSETMRKQTCLSKYGVENYAELSDVRAHLSEISKSDEIREKREQTSLVRWGAENPSKNPEVRKRISNTVRSAECQKRIKETMKERYGHYSAMPNPDILNKYKATCEDKFGVPYACLTDTCVQAQGSIISVPNRSIGDLLETYGLSYGFEYRISHYSYDLEVKPNILIEVNPTYTHNAVGNVWGAGKDIVYHVNKTMVAKENGFRCINIWDWDDVHKVISLIIPKSPVYARKCTLSVIDAKTANEFETKFHLQESVKGQTICLGLYYNSDLVQIMTFGKPRYNKNFEWEIGRAHV